MASLLLPCSVPGRGGLLRGRQRSGNLNKAYSGPAQARCVRPRQLHPFFVDLVFCRRCSVAAVGCFRFADFGRTKGVLKVKQELHCVLGRFRGSRRT